MRCLPLVAILLSVLLSGCPEPRPAARDDAPCERLGERCRTPEGPLGVCNEQGGDCASPPCLTCVPQH